MEKESEIERIVAQAIGELNLQRGADEQLGCGPGDLLFGPGGVLDSLGLVMLIAELENRFETAFGRRVNLADEELLERDESPFASVGALRKYLEEIA